MKNTILYFILLSTGFCFSKGKLLFTSNTTGKLIIDGQIIKQCQSNQYYTFSLIEGVHSIQFNQLNISLLDTTISIINQNQSFIKVEALLDNKGTYIYKQVHTPSNNNVNNQISHTDTSSTNQTNIDLYPVEISKFVFKPKKLGLETDKYIDTKYFYFEKGSSISIQSKKSKVTGNQLLNEVDIHLFGNRDNFETKISLVHLATGVELTYDYLKLDTKSTLNFEIKESGKYAIVCNSKKFDLETSVELYSKELQNSPYYVITTKKYEYDLIKINKNYFQNSNTLKENYSIFLPSNTAYWNYYIASSSIENIDQLSDSIKSNQKPYLCTNSCVFKESQTQNFMNYYSVNTISMNYNTIDNKQVMEPVIQRFSIGVTYSKRVKYLAPHTLYVLVCKEIEVVE